MISPHTFHIPVMGISYTVDTPLKVAPFGIDSVLSINDDTTLERLRKKYSLQFSLPYEEISKKEDDYRAKRISAYLNMLKKLISDKFNSIKNDPNGSSPDLKKYFSMLPDNSPLKQEYIKQNNTATEQLRSQMFMGNIDVNIMTKIDKENYIGDEKLPSEYNDAHSALRGYAQSDLKSSIIFSAGLNQSLYSYIAQFEDFFPNENMELNKKIVLKVSDYRSALIQGKFLAKKGLWVSEYRVESGLNCGGHAFATDGFLMGPILAEFKKHREELIDSLHPVLVKALSKRNKISPAKPLPIKVTAQGGVGTAEEHHFLRDHYGIDSVGWGTPFLLVPEATTVDKKTLARLVDAKEEDLYLSNISPIGVPFNNLRDNSKDQEKVALIKSGKPGSPCPKKFLTFNREYSAKGICTASKQFQSIKIKELNELDIPQDEYQKKYAKIVEKACLCVGLVAATFWVNGIEEKADGEGVSICPGPNLAYFSKTMTLNEICDHIYGRINVISRTDRPNFFIKELSMYVDYLVDLIENAKDSNDAKQENYLLNFLDNLKLGIQYYYDLFNSLEKSFKQTKADAIKGLDNCRIRLETIQKDIKKLFNNTFYPINTTV